LAFNQGVTDTLTHGVRRPVPSRRWARVVLALLVVAAGVTWLADRQVQRHEQAELASCAATALDAVQQAERHVTMAVHAVGSPISYALSDGVRESLYADVSRSARTVAPAVSRAVRGCAGMHVLGWHHDLVARKERCLARLEGTRDYLVAVVHDGREAFRAYPRPPDAVPRPGDC